MEPREASASSRAVRRATFAWARAAEGSGRRCDTGWNRDELVRQRDLVSAECCEYCNAQIRLRLMATELRALDQAVDHRGYFGSAP